MNGAIKTTVFGSRTTGAKCSSGPWGSENRTMFQTMSECQGHRTFYMTPSKNP